MNKVSLINYSQPPSEAGSFMSALMEALRQSAEDGDHPLKQQVAHCARVSNPSNQHNTETSSKLLKYLIKHKHWSPFEMVSICLEIDTPRDIARQILRHRSFSFQEFSQRYADPNEALGFDTRKARFQDRKNRQNSIDIDSKKVKHLALSDAFESKQKALIDDAVTTYYWALEQGIAKEQARAVLPEGLTMSRLYMNGTLRSWIHYIDLRSGKETQKEHRDVAIRCAKAIEPIYPDIMDFVNNS